MLDTFQAPWTSAPHADLFVSGFTLIRRGISPLLAWWYPINNAFFAFFLNFCVSDTEPPLPLEAPLIAARARIERQTQAWSDARERTRRLLP